MTKRTEFPWGKLPPIKIYNSMTRREEEFPPVDEHPEVSIYVCGPTTYSFVHIGNMRNPIFYDVVRRIFKAHGYRVKFVTNFTDIDDKIIAEAKKVGETDPIQLSARFVHEYYTDLFGLGVEKADYYPKVSAHISDIVDYVKLILDNGHAYVSDVDHSVYFDTTSYPDYLKLSGHDFDRLLDNVSQGDEQSAKKDPRDFALWKAAKPGEPTWPFTSKKYKVADGRPGWHIECSVMSAKYLGPSFDIHGGGKELKFPHHENEIAQAKCGHPDADFARIWMHNEWVVLPSGEKMAKSGTSILIRDVLKKYHPDVIRLFLLSAHYRKEVEFSKEKLDEVVKARNKLLETFRRLTDSLKWRAEEREENWLQYWESWDKVNNPNREEKIRRFKEGAEAEFSTDILPPGDPETVYLIDEVCRCLIHFHEKLANDFDTQGAIGILFFLALKINSMTKWYGSLVIEDIEPANIALGAFCYMLNVLGLLKAERESLYLTEEVREETAKGGGDASKLAEVLLKLRDQARSEKNFAMADSIRDMLAGIGAEVRDSKDGPRIVWK